MDRSKFFKELEALQAQFDNMSPELVEVLRDKDPELEGYIVVWNTGIAEHGPLGRCGKGGTRITPDITLEEIKTLAKIMALKNAAAGLPLGGAKSGLKADPDEAGFEEKYRRFINLGKPYLRENGGIFGGVGFDIGARPIHAIWAYEELGSTKSSTGKPLEFGGTDYDREGIAGLGVAVAAKNAVQFGKKELDSTTGAIQGLGAMGAAVLKYFTSLGGRINCISDPRIGGTFFFEQGVPSELRAAISVGDLAKVSDILKGEQAFPLDEVLYANCDVLFPCAVQNVITEENCDRIKAGIVVEGANFPTTSKAQSLLFQRGITVIPDFIANPGGIIAAFVELSSDISPEENARTKANVVQAKKLTEEKIAFNVRSILEEACRLGVEPREVGMYRALKAILGLG